jgi:UDP-3-O-[3-hydroxymyristoyl] N-acetylglucosamine deacetylase
VAESRTAGIRFFFGSEESFLVEEATAEGDGRGSTLSFPNGITIRTVEHLLSALAGVGLWNAAIRVEGGEIPALDGSAAPFARELALFPETKKPVGVEPLRIGAPVSIRDKNQGRTLIVVPAETFGVSCVIDYPGTWIGTQAYCAERLDSTVFRQEIAEARTFCLESELDALRAAGLGKGGNFQNTLVIGKGGPLNPEALSFPDGCVRHKVLDLIGDLTLLGRPIAGHVVAFRSGHGIHLSLVSRLRCIARNLKRENNAKEDPAC